MSNSPARYQSSRLTSFPMLPVMLGGSLLISLLTAGLLLLLFRNGWYIVVLIPMLIAMLVAALVGLLVGLCKCRNTWLAGGIGMLTGMGGYLGYYYLSVATMLPVWPNPINLPRIILFRMASDVQVDMGRPGNADKKSTEFLNWGAFAIEALTFAGAPLAFAIERSRRAYCERLGKWYEKESISVQKGYGESIALAMKNNMLARTAHNLPKAVDPQNSESVTLEFVRPSNGQSPLEYPMYLSISSADALKRAFGSQQYRQMQLEPDQILDLLPIFPRASQFLSAQHHEIQQLVSQTGQIQANELADQHKVAKRATVTPIDEPYRKQLQDKSYKWWVNLVGLIPIYALAGGAGMIATGAWWLNWGNGPFTTTVIATAVSLIVLGACSIAAGLYSAISLLGVPETIWINRRFRTLLKRRPNLPNWVDSPKSTLVSLTPRESFLKVGLTMSSDVLLCHVEPATGMMLMIGDSDQYQIPLDSITEIEPVCFFHPMDRQQVNQLWYARLMVVFEDQARELLLSIANLSFKPSTNATRQAKATAFCEQLIGIKNGSWSPT